MSSKQILSMAYNIMSFMTLNNSLTFCNMVKYKLWQNSKDQITLGAKCILSFIISHFAHETFKY